MHVNGKRIAFLGLLLAFSVLLVIFSGIWEMNTLFLLAAASFCIGIAIREAGLSLGFGFFIAATILSFMLAPNKFYCLTYTAMSLYILLIEAMGIRRMNKQNKRNTQLSRVRIWFMKYIIFNIMYISILLFFPKLIYQGNIKSMILILLFIGGQIVLFVYDMAYHYFLNTIWIKMRRYMN